MPKRNEARRQGARRGGARQFVGKVARRGAQRLDGLQARLLNERAGRGGAGKKPKPAGAARRAPGPVEGLPVPGKAHEAFFRVLEQDGDFALAATTLMREYFARNGTRRSRIFAQALQQQAGQLGDVGDICVGLLDLRNERLASAWDLLSHVDQAQALRLAPVEYFRAGFSVDPETAGKALDAVSRGVHRVEADAAGWLEIAQVSFAAGAEEPSRFAFEAARAALPGAGEAPRVRADLAWLERWYGRSAAAAEPVSCPAGEIPVAVLGYRQPDRANTSTDLGDYLGTLAVLAQLARRTPVRFSGEPRLVSVCDELRSRVGADQQISGGEFSTVRLYPVDRDASSLAAVPENTWLIVTGRLPRTMFDIRVDLPVNPRLRPIFLSVHVPSAEMLTQDVLDHLRRHAPIGCHDWSSVQLLQAAGVPAFFAGDVTATLNSIVGGPPPAGAGRLFVDTPAKRGGDTARQSYDGVRGRGLAENLRAAAQLVSDLHTKYGAVTTSQLETYLAARAAGAQTEFLPANRAQRRLDGLLDLDARGFEAMQRAITGNLAAVLDVLLAGVSADEVYAAWRQVTAAAVADADARRAAPLAPLPLGFDLAKACATIRRASVTVDRTEAGPDGPEINVELSLDGNYKHQLEVVVDSIVAHASRPVRAFVLCRDHTSADYRRLAALFPTVSFVWLPTDAVDYGNLGGLISHTTVATIDRLLLPDLLPDVERIIHHDLDAICLADLAELDDVDLRGNPIAGRTSPHPSRVSAFGALVRKSERFRADPEIGRDLIRRTHTGQPFDFPVFNAGVMVLDLGLMRADDFCARFLPYVARFEMHDQQVLNVYAGPRRTELAAGWNWMPWLESVAEPKIAHWAGDFKPWRHPWVAGRDLWRAGEDRLAARYSDAGVPPLG